LEEAKEAVINKVKLKIHSSLFLTTRRPLQCAAIWGRFTQFDTKRFITSTAKYSVFGKHGACEVCREIVMSKLSRMQKATVANFLQVSRVHFGLFHRNVSRQTRLRHFRRTIIQSLLLAGSVGIPFGSTAYAEMSANEKPEMRDGWTSPHSPSTTEKQHGRSPIERMP